jgi:hypothetical protein
MPSALRLTNEHSIGLSYGTARFSCKNFIASRRWRGEYAAARQRQTDPVASNILMIGRARLPPG